MRFCFLAVFGEMCAYHENVYIEREREEKRRAGADVVQRAAASAASVAEAGRRGSNEKEG